MLCFCLVFRIFVIVEDLSSEFQEIDSNIYNDRLRKFGISAGNVSQFEMNDTVAIQFDNIFSTSCI